MKLSFALLAAFIGLGLATTAGRITQRGRPYTNCVSAYFEEASRKAAQTVPRGVSRTSDRFLARVCLYTSTTKFKMRLRQNTDKQPDERAPAMIAAYDQQIDSLGVCLRRRLTNDETSEVLAPLYEAKEIMLSNDATVGCADDP